MSTWIEPKKEDMEIDGDELNIYVMSDYGGAIYVCPKIADIKRILEKKKPSKDKY